MNRDKKRASIGQVKEHLSAYLTQTERGKTIVVCCRNRPVADRVGTQPAPSRNRTRWGSAPGSVIVKRDQTEPALSERDWDLTR